MTWWGILDLVAVMLVSGCALYIRLRWRRSPQAHRAMIVLAACYFVAGSFLGAWALHLGAPKPAEIATAGPSASMPVPPSPAGMVSPASGSTQSNYLPNRYSGKVVGATDGDTIDVAIAPAGLVQSVRLEGIDAPESAQPFGADSTRHLSELVSGKAIALQCEYERSYGRLICKVLLPTGEDVDLDQVKAGLAWHYKQYEDEQSSVDREAYASAECTAMKAKLGLWSDPHPVQPQDFRHYTHSPLLFDANGCRTSSEPTSGPVVGNARTHIFEWAACPYYSAISPDNQVPFPSPQAAEAAGYRPAHNCP
jgi:endonuclease YncB( thermonuclease family)